MMDYYKSIYCIPWMLFLLLLLSLVTAEVTVSPFADRVYANMKEKGFTGTPPATPYIDAYGREVFSLALTTYCSAANLTTWTCFWCNQTVVPVQKVAVIDSLGFNAQGWIGLYKGKIVIAFRGTQSSSLTNWYENMKFAQTQLWDNDTEILVHRGFLQTYKSLREGLLAQLPQFRAYCSSCSLLITGHSLGGAMATLASVDLQKNFPEFGIPELYTYGCPRVGNAKFAQLVASMTTSHFRVVYSRDVVPRIPTHIFEIIGLSYWHTGYEVWYHNRTDWQVGDGSGEDPKLSISIPFLSTSVADHLLYYGVIMNQGRANGC